MATYTIRLDQLHASNIRDKTQDDLSAWLIVKVDGQMIPAQNPPPDGSSGNPVSGQLASGVHTGDTIRFADYTPVIVPTWEFTFDADGPDDTQIDLLFLVKNTHGESSEDIQRFIVKLYYAFAGAVIGAALDDASKIFGAVLGGLVGTGAGEGVASLFFSDPPQCQGTAFTYGFRTSLGALKRLPYSDGNISADGEMSSQWSITIPSDPILDIQQGCGLPPHYELTFSILRKEQLSLFGGPGIGTQAFIGAVDRGLDQWVGEWGYQATSSESPRITCTIARSLAHPHALHVTLSEHFGNWNGAGIVGLDVDGVIPRQLGHFFYAGDVLPGRRKVFMPPFITHLQQRPGVIPSGAENVGNIQQRAEMLHGAEHKLANVGQSSPMVVETQHTISSVFSDQLLPVLPLLMEQADTIVISDKNVNLCLYAHTANGLETGLFIRYMRDADLTFTRTDVLLGHPSVLY